MSFCFKSDPSCHSHKSFSIKKLLSLYETKQQIIMTSLAKAIVFLQPQWCHDAEHKYESCSLRHDWCIDAPAFYLMPYSGKFLARKKFKCLRIKISRKRVSQRIKKYTHPRRKSQNSLDNNMIDTKDGHWPLKNLQKNCKIFLSLFFFIFSLNSQTFCSSLCSLQCIAQPTYISISLITRNHYDLSSCSLNYEDANEVVLIKWLPVMKDMRVIFWCLNQGVIRRLTSFSSFDFSLPCQKKDKQKAVFVKRHILK